MKDKKSAYISEIFDSIQGEGIFNGVRQIFIRFSGCNLNCSYCDTDHKKKNVCSVYKLAHSGRPSRISTVKNPMTVNDIVSILKEYLSRNPHKRSDAYHSIVFTGGEPLLRSDFIKELLLQIRQMGFKAYLETNGTKPKELKKIVSKIDYIAMDIKLPSATNRFFWSEHKEFLEIGRKKIFVKLIIDSKTKLNEIRKAVMLVVSINKKMPFILQPATINSKKIFDIEKVISFRKEISDILKDIRIIPQMHKIIGIK